MNDEKATILWFRRDLRLSDHPALRAAVASGGAVIPVFILDPLMEEQLGAASRWRLGQSLASLAQALERAGSTLILRRGEALDVLEALAAETGARTVHWSRLYDARAIARDTGVKAALTEKGLEARSFNASLLHEPWEVETQTGGPYRVYSPFWRAVAPRDVAEPEAAPAKMPAPSAWPASDRLEDWRLGAAMDRGAAVVARHACIGEESARGRLGAFIAGKIESYKDERDRPDREATSRLSENLAYGEISPRTIWHAGKRAMEGFGARGSAKNAEHFLKELVWREFAYHLLYHTPEIEDRNWRAEWDDFPWQDDSEAAERWRRGMTGVEMVDAAMREMYVTGTMHNRTRMLVASYLTKHMMTHWRIGQEWFRQCLTDWDIASNAMGWQWVAGSGPDAAPYFRIFNPDGQAEKFDPECIYRDRFLVEGRKRPHEDALSFFEAVPRSWGLSPDQPYLTPVVGLAEGRARALAAYEKRRPAA